MAYISNEITVKIIEEVIKTVPYFGVDIPQQIKLREKIEELLNDYEITSRCTDLVTSDFREKAFIFLSCKRLEGMSEGTNYNYRLLFKVMAEYFVKPVSMITTIDLRMFLAKAYPGNQPSSINSKIWKIKDLFQWLQDEGYLVQNPARNLNPTKEPIRKRGYVKALDVEMIREQCKTIRDKALFDFLLSTGCRVSEASNALISKIDWTNNHIDVIGKGNKERTVIFSTKSRLHIMNYLKEREEKGIHSDYLFVASKKPYRKLGRRSIERDIDKLAERAGITYDIFPHLLRHTFATMAVNQDVSLPALQQLMGNESPDTTQVYYEFNDDSIAKEYKKMAQ